MDVGVAVVANVCTVQIGAAQHWFELPGVRFARVERTCARRLHNKTQFASHLLALIDELCVGHAPLRAAILEFVHVHKLTSLCAPNHDG